jgi:hypothetical protein
MAMVTTAKHGATFNKKSSIIVNGGTTAPYFDVRTNYSIPTTATSGDITARYDTSFDEVYYYISAASGAY